MKLLIFGGTGSFGNAMLSLVKDKFDEIIVFSRDEKKQYDMQQFYNKNKNIRYIIGDIRNYDSVENALKGVDYVFAASAMKQVPTCEQFPYEAVQTNIIGNNNILNACEKTHVKKVIMLSTDKAVAPINVMGATKMIMEKLTLAKARSTSTTDFIITRYGNVAGSRGSVIPLFYKQLLNKQPITITDKQMTRFIMSLDDAIHLVLHALNTQSNNGHIYIYKAKKINIYDLVFELGNFLNIDMTSYPIEYIGKRPGEKIHEILATTEELSYSTEDDTFIDINFQNNPKTVSKPYTSQTAETISYKELITIFNSLPFIMEKNI